MKLTKKEDISIAKNVRITPRKARLIIDLIRGKKVSDALLLLQNGNINKKGVLDIFKVVKSAASNAVNNKKLNADKLYIESIFANDGIRFKRMMPRAKGNSARIIKRTSHITVIVKEKESE